MIRATPYDEHPTHDVSLTDPDGVTVGLVLCDSRGDHNALAITRSPMERTAMKTTSGNQKYSDFEPPWTPIAQDDWSGGRGKEDYDDDTTRFFDSRRANTMNGKIMLGAQETYTTGFRSMQQSMPGSVKWVQMIAGKQKYLAKSFVAGATFDVKHLSVLVRRIGTPTADLTVELCADGVGQPGAVMETVTISTTEITDVVSEFYKSALTTAQTITSGIAYWIKVYSAAGDDINHWEVGVKDAAGSTKESGDDTTYSDALIDLYYRLTPAEIGFSQRLFTYKRAQYLVRSDGTTVKLWINSDRGAADSNAGQLTKLIDATKTWVANEWAGCIALLISGLGASEEQPWRVITSNDGTSLTVDSPWLITHDTTTAYVILGADTWREVTGHGLTVFPTDILDINAIVYFGQGDAVNMRRMTWTAAATHAFAADGTNKADKLAAVQQSTDGAWKIWKANNDTTGVAKSDLKAWGTDLAFGTAITFSDPWGKITGIVSYGDEVQNLWVMREGTVFYISSDKAYEIPLSEMHNLMETSNGKASLIHGTYLYFNLADGIERYYNRQLDDVGPNRDKGLPTERQGNITAFLGYPGSYFAVVDAGASGTSSVLNNNGAGWHEWYRAPMPGERITSVCSQTIPGVTLDRMWLTVGDDVIWLPLVLRPENDSNFRHTFEGTLTSGYMYAGLQDIFKLYQSMKIFSEFLGDECTVELDYQLDENTAWKRASGTFDTSPIQEVNLLPELSETGKRMRYRVRLLTTDNSKSPKIKSIVTESVSRVPVKFAYSMPYRIIDNDHDLNGVPDGFDAEEKQLILDAWAANLTPLTLRCRLKLFDNKTVFADAIPAKPYQEYGEGYVLTQTLTEV